MAEERRIDPEDGGSYTKIELLAYYKEKYARREVLAYWDTLKPVKASKAKAKAKAAGGAKEEAKPKAEAKAKAKAKARAQAKGPANPKRFVNEESAIVRECVDGLIWATPNLARLDGYPDIKVVFRTDWKKDEVALISGGGAGHEPMHGGFVGQGMLTAAVSGETFASPSIDAVLAAIAQVTGEKGCLLIIKNYTGDRLNFSLAAQRARAQLGLKVELVITKDDVATVAERGIAGSLFVHKIAGAAAAAGKSLAEVKAVAESVIASTASLGVSFSSVRRRGPEMLGRTKMEVGLGIHGEPGARNEDIAPASKVVETILEGILAGARMQVEAPQGYACMINNLGGVPPQEMSIVTAAVMKSAHAEKIKFLVGPAAFCTSLDMNGVSLSLLRLSDELTPYLQAPTGVATWPAAVKPAYPETVECMKGLDPMENVQASSDEVVLTALEKICKVLIDSRAELDELDTKVGDGDCGYTMFNAASKVLEVKSNLPLADPKALCSCLSSTLGKTMGGSSGVLLSIMFMGMAASFEKASSKTWKDEGAKALMAGLQEMMQAGGASAGSRTMLDALLPAAEALVAGKSLAEAAEAAKAGQEATKTTAPRAGRSENVPKEKWMGNADPGAAAAAKVFHALAQ